MKTKAPRTPRTRIPVRLSKRMQGTLGELERGDLLKAQPDVEPHYAFKHALVQDTALSTLLHGEYKRLNLLVAKAYETIYAARCMDEFAAVLAQHYAAGGDQVNTLAYATRAGDQAMQVYALPEAIAFYTQALSVAIKQATAAAKQSGAATPLFIHLFTNLGRALEISGQYERALASYEDMETVARRTQDRTLALHSLTLRAIIHATGTSVFDPVKARQFAERAVELGRQLDDRAAEARALWVLLIMHRYADNPGEAVRYGEQALALARQLALDELLAYILTDLGGVYTSIGKLERAYALLNEARDLWRAQGNKPMLADNLMLSGVEAFLSGDFARAELFTEEGTLLSRQIGNLLGQSSNEGTQAFVYFEHGLFADALRLAVDINRLAELMNIQFALLQARSTLARMYVEVGALAQAQELAHVAGAMPTQEIPGFFRSWSFAILAHVHLVCGDLAAAEQAIETSKGSQARELIAVPGSNLLDLAEAELALAKGDNEGCSKLLQERIEVIRATGPRLYLGEMLFMRAAALRALGNPEQAAELLEDAYAETEALQARRIVWQILAAQSELEEARGNPERAKEYRTQARDVISFIVEHMPDQYHESFLNLPRVREVMA